MADMYSKLLGLSSTPPPPSNVGKSNPVKTLPPTTEKPPFEELKKPTPSPVAVSPAPKRPSALVKKEEGGKEKMSTSPQTGKPTTPSPVVGLIEKPEKYTTHLEPSLVKQLKLFAVEKDLKDYEVVKNALLLYFERYK